MIIKLRKSDKTRIYRLISSPEIKNLQRLLRPLEKESEMIVIYGGEIRVKFESRKSDKIKIC